MRKGDQRESDSGYSKPHTVREALGFARAQELVDKEVKRIEMEQRSHGTNLEEEMCKFRQKKKTWALRLMVESLRSMPSNKDSCTGIKVTPG